MSLFNKFNKRTYGSEYKGHLFEQYKILVDSAEKTSDRRNIANNFYLGLNTALITFVGITTKVSELSWFKPIIYVVGIFLSVTFWFLINSYKQLNSGKYKVIHKIENHLPLNMFKHEWKVLGEGKDKKLYFPFSHIERCIPIIIGITYLCLLLPYIEKVFLKVCR